MFGVEKEQRSSDLVTEEQETLAVDLITDLRCISDLLAHPHLCGILRILILNLH